ncbi:MAG: hypothetical protein ACLR23_03660 [Clostridia bacterium]|uniref:Uncharacterized protein n=1 Tax=Bianquea renquensis TaxID=2763661 RepID=A0A926I2H0_9FIRM|nr:hypothetical protein [Bianquea renquensis]MBC8544488.1 hypothetical protein [Bianquea renquensis]
MHAGEANNSIGQRAHGGNFHAATVKTITTAEIQNEKCTPARRTIASASGHSEAISTPPPSKRPRRRRYKMKNARRRGEQRLRLAGTRRQIPRRHRRDDQAGGDTE